MVVPTCETRTLIPASIGRCWSNFTVNTVEIALNPNRTFIFLQLQLDYVHYNYDFSWLFLQYVHGNYNILMVSESLGNYSFLVNVSERSLSQLNAKKGQYWRLVWDLRNPNPWCKWQMRWRTRSVDLVLLGKLDWLELLIVKRELEEKAASLYVLFVVYITLTSH